MKKYLIAIAFLVVAGTQAQAQVEVKINPVALLFTGIGVGVEYGFSDVVGAELSALIVEDGGAVWLAGKYYLKPQEGLDRFYMGLYTGTTGEDLGLGFLIGSKVKSRNSRALFDIGIGAGRTFEGSFLPYGRISVGLRFGD